MTEGALSITPTAISRFGQALFDSLREIQGRLLEEYNADVSEREHKLRESVAVLSQQNLELIQRWHDREGTKSALPEGSPKSGMHVLEVHKEASHCESRCESRKQLAVLQEHVARICAQLGVEAALNLPPKPLAAETGCELPKPLPAEIEFGFTNDEWQSFSCLQDVQQQQLEALREKTAIGDWADDAAEPTPADGNLLDKISEKTVSICEPNLEDAREVHYESENLFAKGLQFSEGLPRSGGSSPHKRGSMSEKSSSCRGSRFSRLSDACSPMMRSLRSTSLTSQGDCRSFVLHDCWRADSSPGGGRVSSNIIEMAHSQSFHSDESEELKSDMEMDCLVSQDDEGDVNRLAKRFWWVLHPSSRRRLVWDLTGMIMLFYDLLVMPVQIGFMLEENPFFATMQMITGVYWTMDAFMSLVTGYYTRDGKVVVHPQQIFIKYLKTWFFLDCMIITLDWVLIGFDSMGEQGGSDMRAGRFLRFLRMLRVVRLLRLAKLQKVMRIIQDRIDSEYVTILLNVGKHMLLILATCHMVACGWYRIGLDSLSGGAFYKEGELSWVEVHGVRDSAVVYKYLTALHWSLTQFTPASMSVNPHNVRERLFAVIVLLYAMLSLSSFVSSITTASTTLRNIGAKQNAQFWLLRKYFRQNNISQELSNRVYRYVSMVLQTERTRVQQRDVELISILSAPLRIGLQTELYEPQLVGHNFFSNMARRCRPIIRKLCCTAIKEVALSRGDVLFTTGETAKAMFFLTRGCLAYMDTSKQQTYLKKGQWCCEAVLWTDWVHLGTMIARMETELLALDSKQFQHVVMEHPAEIMYPRRYASDFLDRLNDSFDNGGEFYSDVITAMVARNSLRRSTASLLRQSFQDLS